MWLLQNKLQVQGLQFHPKAIELNAKNALSAAAVVFANLIILFHFNSTQTYLSVDDGDS